MQIYQLINQTRLTGSKMLFLISSMLISRWSSRLLIDSTSTAMRTLIKLKSSSLFSTEIPSAYFSLILLASSS